jgi:hypothetical protein
VEDNKTTCKLVYQFKEQIEKVEQQEQKAIALSWGGKSEFVNKGTQTEQ